MFLAGLELDLDRFNRSRKTALTFGALTVHAPLRVWPDRRAGLRLHGSRGDPVRLALGVAHAGVLPDRPAARDHARPGRSGSPRAGRCSPTLPRCFVLAVVAGAQSSDENPAQLVVELTVGVIGLAVYALVVLPRVARWGFARARSAARCALPRAARGDVVGGGARRRRRDRGHRRRVLRRARAQPARSRAKPADGAHRVRRRDDS